uniref:Aldehyde dehydrogenase domain-containing protein n=1 Tax=Photinus pyralis TaxID=7054 RepID=A0A1Y1JZQ7_PHOPY
MGHENGSKSIKSTTIKQVFRTMDYGTITENVSSAKAWLEDLAAIGAYKRDIVLSYGKSLLVHSKGLDIPIQVISPLPEDVDEIVAANKSDWTGKQRSVLLYKLSIELENNSSLICQLEVLIRGILSKHAMSSLHLLIDHLRFYSGYAATNEKKIEGVSLSVVSDDVFLSAFGNILGPALAAGVDVILQTEPRISVLATLFKQLAEKVGFPKNAIQLLPGDVNLTNLLQNDSIGFINCFGKVLGKTFPNLESLVKAPVIAVTKTKGPMIVFNNADLESASDAVINAAWGSATVLPWSLSIVMVQEDVYKVFVSKLNDHLSKVRIGPAYEKLADVSSVHESQLFNIQKVVEEAKVVGLQVLQSTSQSSQFQTTVILGGDVLKNVSLEQSDVAVVTVIAFRHTNEALSLSNNFKSKMGVSVWTENIGLANELAQKLQFSNVWINSFAKFSASHSTYLDKNSGVGYIGGVDGACEYYKNGSDPEKLTFDISAARSFYLHDIDGFYGNLVGRSVSSAVVSSKKGYDLWKKGNISDRFRMLANLSFALESRKELISKNTGVPCFILDYWVSTTYKLYAQFADVGQVEHKGSHVIRTCREPVGIIVIDESNSLSTLFDCVIGSLLLGNAVIVLNLHEKLIDFYAEIYQLLATAKFPSGVFNVILNCQNDTFDSLLSFDDLNTFITFTRRPNMKIGNIKRICDGRMSSSLLSYVTKTKNVWSSIGHSVL